jgi:hypothetical protein
MPLQGIAALAFALVFPPYSIRYTILRSAERSRLKDLVQLDWLGALLHIGVTSLLFLTLTFSGAVYPWNSGRIITMWVLEGVLFICYCLQQGWCITTSKEHQIFPVSILSNRAAMLSALGTMCAAIGYSAAIYYLPLFFAFTRGLGPLSTAVHLLPFIGCFIGLTLIVGGGLPKIGRYFLLYIFSAVFSITSGVLFATQVTPQTSTSRVLGYSALLGVGVGALFQHGVSVSNGILPAHQRFDGNALQSIAQLGGGALGLALAGCIFQNRGFTLVQAAVGKYGYSDLDIKEALSGVHSPIFTTGNSIVRTLAVKAATEGIREIYFLVVGAGALCLLAGLAMPREKIDFKASKQERNNMEETGSRDGRDKN